MKKISYMLMCIALISILKLHFVSLLFAIALTYIFMDKINTIVFTTTNFIDSDEDKKQNFLFKILNKNVKLISSFVIGILLISFFTFFGTWLINFLSPSNLSEMFIKIENILEAQKNSKYLPDFFYQYFPSNFDSLKNQSIDLLKNYAGDIKNIGKSGLTFIVYIILGCIIGCMINLNHITTKTYKPLAKELVDRISTFKQSFELVFLAQIKISLINTALTTIYIYVALPLFDYNLPFKNTIVVLTFLLGLIPVLGNLISNTIIIVLSLGLGFNLAIISLLFLVIIHKLEYFLDAKIIGSQIQAKTWEILLVLILFETLFGISGIIVGSIYYCYLKQELKDYV